MWLSYTFPTQKHPKPLASAPEWHPAFCKRSQGPALQRTGTGDPGPHPLGVALSASSRFPPCWVLHSAFILLLTHGIPPDCPQDPGPQDRGERRCRRPQHSSGTSSWEGLCARTDRGTSFPGASDVSVQGQTHSTGSLLGSWLHPTPRKRPQKLKGSETWVLGGVHFCAAPKCFVTKAHRRKG